MLAHQEDIKELVGRVTVVNKIIGEFDCGKKTMKKNNSFTVAKGR